MDGEVAEPLGPRAKCLPRQIECSTSSIDPRPDDLRPYLDECRHGLLTSWTATRLQSRQASLAQHGGEWRWASSVSRS